MRFLSPHLGFAALAALLALAAEASAQQDQAPTETSSLERGRTLYLEADFEGARTAFESALESPDLVSADAVEAHRYLAALSLIVGDTEGAGLSAVIALSLDRTAQAPEGSPPELAELLDEVRGAIASEAPAIAIEAPAEGLQQGTSSTVSAELRAAPEGLFATLQLGCTAEGTPEATAEGAPPTVQVEVTPGREAELLECEARAATPSGAVLLRGGLEIPVEAGGAAAVVGQVREVPWWAWVAGAGGVAVVAAVVAVVVVTAAGSGEANLEAPRVEGW